MMIGGARVEPKRKIFEILREKNSKHLIACSQKGAKHTKFRFRKYPNICVVHKSRLGGERGGSLECCQNVKNAA